MTFGIRNNRSSDLDRSGQDVSCDDSTEFCAVRQPLRERVPIEDLGHRQAVHSRFVIVAEVELEGLDQLGEGVAQRCGQVRKR